MNDRQKPYTIYRNNVAIGMTDALIVAPQQALEDPSQIRLQCDAFDSSGKHTLFSLSQIALIDFEDGAVEPLVVPAEDRIGFDLGRGRQALDAGIIIYRSTSGGATILATGVEDVKRLLKEIHRYCTRFIRLDVH